MNIASPAAFEEFWQQELFGSPVAVWLGFAAVVIVCSLLVLAPVALVRCWKRRKGLSDQQVFNQAAEFALTPEKSLFAWLIVWPFIISGVLWAIEETLSDARDYEAGRSDSFDSIPEIRGIYLLFGYWGVAILGGVCVVILIWIWFNAGNNRFKAWLSRSKTRL